nr:putative reverse transcriptase domain-containing protein [Tanacetum cinerariifolium]
MPFGLTNAPATREEQEVHLGQVLELLKKEKLYAKFSKYPSKIEAIKNWKAPRTLSEVRLFLGLTSFLAIMTAKFATTMEACDESTKLQKGLDEMIKHRSDGALYYLDRLWVPLKGDVRTLIMDEAHKSKYSLRPEADKMYYDLRNRIWCLYLEEGCCVE